ncbi:MAG: amidohydrolase family protein, partial [Opitutaceae bacterium]
RSNAQPPHRGPDPRGGPRPHAGNSGQAGRGQRNPRDPRSGARPLPSANTPPPRPAAVVAPRPAPVAAVVAAAGVPHGSREGGWLPDLVYTGDKFEAGLAFFADATGRITRFSREPADLATARRLAGQAALPGLVNAHSHALARLGRGEAETGRFNHLLPPAAAVAQLGAEDVFDTARLVFLEMLLSGVTSVGEFHALHRGAEGADVATDFGREVVRAAHDVGLRIALLRVAILRGGHASQTAATPPPGALSASADQFTRETEALRLAIERDFPADEAWLGVAPDSLATVPPEAFKVIGNYARAQRLRLHTHAASSAEDVAACVAEHGRTPLALLADLGLVDKRLTVVDARRLTDDEVRALGTARAAACLTPGNAAPVAALSSAGAGVAAGTDVQTPASPLAVARAAGFEDAAAAWRSATVAGARSLGATGGALEVGRPADFFTVSLSDPALAGVEPRALPALLLATLDRRMIRDVWVGARQRIAGGRHLAQGQIIGRFIGLQDRLRGRSSQPAATLEATG